MSDEDFTALLLAADGSSSEPLPLPAEAPALVGLFAALLAAIEIALDANHVAEADRLVALGWRIARQTGEPEHAARAHWCSGVALLNRAHREALAHYAVARPYFERHGPPDDCARVLLGYGMAAGFLGRLDEAEAALHEAAGRLAAEPDHPHWMRLALNLSLVLGLRGRFVEMREQAARSAAAAERYQHDLIHASALVNQGIAAMALGELDAADAVLHQALRGAGDAAEVSGRALVNLARLALYRGQLFTALHLLAQARDRFASVQLDIDEATVAIESASLYERLLLPREARQQAVFAAEAFALAGLPPESIEARLLAIRLALAAGKLSQIPPHLEAAEQLAGAVAPTWQALLQGYAAAPLLAGSPARLPGALARLDAAVADLQARGAVPEELELALLGALLGSRVSRAEGKRRYQHVAEVARSHGLAAHELRACEGLAAQLPPRAACGPLRRAADLLQAQRRQMPVEELKACLLSGARTIYARLIEALLASRQPAAAAETLLEAKGGPWADLAAPAAPVAPDAAWLAARVALTTWQEEHRYAADPEYQAVCAQRMREAEAALSAASRLQARLREPQPLPSIAAVSSGIAPGSVVIEYLVGSTHLHACLLLPGAPPHWVQLCRIVELSAVTGRLELLLGSLRATGTPAQRQAAVTHQRPLADALLAQLGELLIAPLRPWLPPAGELLIAPDERLFDVPWAALHSTDGYLSERYPLLLIPSAAVLGLPPGVSPQLNPPLAVGYAGDPPLAQIAAELAALHELIPGLRSHDPARVADLHGIAAPVILHIAAHGHIRRDAPLLSRLDLADGPLLLADALNLRLHGTRLVTLSACDSGTQPDRGGALLALSGAFLLAGAECVLASLWPVDDGATRLLMGALYQALQQGAPLPGALQRAQAALRDRPYSHPIDWAAFQLIARCRPTAPLL